VERIHQSAVLQRKHLDACVAVPKGAVSDQAIELGRQVVVGRAVRGSDRKRKNRRDGQEWSQTGNLSRCVNPTGPPDRR
jgi:hypothetical protein